MLDGWAKNKPGSIGIILDVEAHIIHPDGSFASPNESGELIRNDKATRETCIDGWLHTGDQIRIDEDGVLSFEDHTKDTLNISGMHVGLGLHVFYSHFRFPKRRPLVGLSHDVWRLQPVGVRPSSLLLPSFPPSLLVKRSSLHPFPSRELHDIVAIWCAIENTPEIIPVCGRPGMSTGWVVAQRTFDIERTGEITRGMFVTDRREESTAYAPGANRAEVQAQLDLRQLGHGLLESTALPARVNIEDPILLAGGQGEVGLEQKERKGVECLVETPGPSVLLQLLTRTGSGAFNDSHLQMQIDISYKFLRTETLIITIVPSSRKSFLETPNIIEYHEHSYYL
ncbi:hypothetical protein EV702DRAFT_1248964 [Suillus placidus]|uniref:AMP-dependent synthetase/ligase domain-containing protein n=1 Tax=Suillus placidus TaxID=48579 RepID=A0A9P7CZ45_9AGAM|nr:hypothetical protein EV702DRAFT_1248964 [Suillus placidus]